MIFNNRPKPLTDQTAEHTDQRRDYEQNPELPSSGIWPLAVLCGILFALAGNTTKAANDQVAAETVATESAPIGEFGARYLQAGSITTLVPNKQTLDFGNLDEAETVSRELVLTHNGDAASKPLTINSIFLDELDEKSFSSSFRGPVTVFPNESYTIEISFSPQNAGKTVGSLFIDHSGAGGNHHIVLTGQSGSDEGTNKTSSASQTQIPVITTRATPAFGKSQLSGIGNITPTSLQFGPDGRLYAADLSGQIKIYTVQRNDSNEYSVVSTETLNHIKNIPNHNDNGSVNNSLGKRLVTGLLVTGSASNPIIYVNSSDPRIGGGASGNSTNLDTNSTMLSRLTKNGNGWQKLDLVRGLPRSEENHHANGMALDASGNKLYIAMGGNTNQGATSNNFALLPEYALSAAILEVDLAQIGNSTYDLPTLNDENRAGVNDANDPFGGNGGKNQAKIVPGGPVQVYAPGFRNPYDIVIAQNGKMYTWDNGSNAGWGGTPVGNGEQGVCTNGVKEPGKTNFDTLHHITGPGYYGGHPNPTRGNKNNTFNNSNPQSPVPFSNPVECEHRAPRGPGASKHPQNTSLTDITSSTNGLTEYTASNFNGAMQGDLLAAAFNNIIYRVQLNSNGTAVQSNSPLFSNVGQTPLDVTAVGDTGPYPGTIWVADFSQKSILVFEPNDYQGSVTNSCNASFGNGDADQDGFTNADENINNTDPCSAADIPADADGDFISDRLDSDDDNDGIADVNDPFAVDPANGSDTPLGTSYDWENSSAAAPFIANMGFSGLMTNGTTNYLDQFDLSQMTISGAAGVVTVDNVPDGDPLNGLNSQEYAFQFGVDVDTSSPVFRAHTRVLAAFAGINAQNFQSMGLFIGTGDQDNYIKLTVNTDGPLGGLQFARELNGAFDISHEVQSTIYGSDSVDLYLEINPALQTAQAFYQIADGGQNGPMQSFGNAISFPASWLNGNTKLAIGIISTSFRAPTFSATWDLIEVVPVGGNTTVANNQAPVVNAGADASITLPVMATLNGQVTDDGLPSNNLVTSWSLVSGPGSVSISNPNALSTNLSFSTAGTYTMQLSASDGVLSQTDEIILFVSDGNPTGPVNNNAPGNFVSVEVENFTSNVPAGNHAWVPSSQAGFSGSGGMITTPDTGTIKNGANGSPLLTYNVNFPAAGTYYVWVRGLGDTNAAGEGKNDSVHVGLNGSFLASADKIDQFPVGSWSWTNSTRDPAVATISIPSPGNHTVNVWMREDGLALDKLEFTTDITYSPSGAGITAGNNTGNGSGNTDGNNTPSNQAPAVNAGTNLSTTVNTAITLAGSVSDDGLPTNAVTTTWTTINGPGNASFTNPGNLSTSVTFNTTGTYTLQLHADDGDLTATDSLVVSVTNANAGTGSNTGTSTNGLSISSTETWDLHLTADNSTVVERHEAGGVELNGKLYVVGGRGNRPVSVFDPASNRWTQKAIPPISLHHFQPVAWNDKIWVLGAFTGIFPNETPVADIYTYTPATDTWATAGSIPSNRQRGSAGAVLHNDRIYIIGGNTNGHNPGAKPWFDEFNPANGQWQTLANAPVARDHTTVAISNNKLVVAGGRQTAFPNTFSNTISATNIYDFNSQQWSQSTAIPTQRAGSMTVAAGNEVIVVGGESAGLTSAHDEVEAFDVTTSAWRSLSPLSTGRHSGAAAVLNNKIHVVTGSERKGGSPESTVHETLDLSGNSSGGPTDNTTNNDNDTNGSTSGSNANNNSQAAIRINAGGPQIVANGNTWVADNSTNSNFANTGRIHSSTSNVSTASLPTQFPADLFKTERWDDASAPEMQWNLPVQPGDYQVNLYFAENYGPAQQTGGRVFSIEIEGILVESNLDVFSEAGARAGLLKTYTVNSDGNLDIDFIHGIQNPSIKAIEILPL